MWLDDLPKDSQALILHHNDMDGRCAAGIIMSYFSKNRIQTPIPMELNYQSSIEDQVGRGTIKRCNIVFILDYSIYREADIELVRAYKDKIVWIDHHATSLKFAQNEDYLEGIVTCGLSGAALTWIYFYEPRMIKDILGNVPVEEARKIVERFPAIIRDVHRWDIFDLDDELLDIVPCIYYKSSHDFSRLLRKEIVKPGYTNIWLKSEAEYGKRINEYDKERNANLMKDYGFVLQVEVHDHTGDDVSTNRYTAYACNVYPANSRMFEALIDIKRRCDLYVAFGYNKLGWNVSLYSNNKDLDVSRLAKSKGGGGHAGAAGYQSLKQPITYNTTLEFDIFNE